MSYLSCIMNLMISFTSYYCRFTTKWPASYWIPNPEANRREERTPKQERLISCKSKELNFYKVPIRQKTITHLGYALDDIRQTYLQYARAISSWDIDFILTLEAESGSRTPDRPSINKKENSVWFCQLSRIRHKKIVDDPRFKDYKRQLEQCWRKYNEWTRMYWFDHRRDNFDNFKIE